MTPAAETVALADARVAGFLTMGIMLHGLGIIADRNVADYTVADDNEKKFTLSFPATPSGAETTWVNFVKRPALHAQNRDQDFWCVYLPDARTLYCNFRGYPRLDQNAAALLREVKDKNPNKLAIDLRQNGGGNYSQGLKYLIDRFAVSLRLIGAAIFLSCLEPALLPPPCRMPPSFASEPPPWWGRLSGRGQTVPGSEGDAVAEFPTARPVFNSVL